MPKRKTISKKARFEVFKRDSFTCQYCGAAAPDAVLHVDHIKPVSKGGDNEIINLITACAGCNGGKGATELDDDAAIVKQKQQLDELNQRREQLKMMLDWREGMKGITESAIDAVCERFDDITAGKLSVNETGRKKLKSLIRKYGLPEVLEALDIAEERYIVLDDEGDSTVESCHQVFAKVGGICHNRSLPEDQQRLAYIRGIVRKRMHCQDWRAMQLLRDASSAGASTDILTGLAKTARNWTTWCADMQDLIDSAGSRHAD